MTERVNPINLPLLAGVALAGVLLTGGCGPKPPPQAPPAPAPPAGTAPAGAPATSPPAASATAGADLYRQNCQACHGDQGQGVKGLGISLVNESGEEEGELRQVILNGRKKMPAFKDKLTDEQVTAIIARLRQFNGGHGEKGEHEEREHSERRR